MAAPSARSRLAHLPHSAAPRPRAARSPRPPALPLPLPLPAAPPSSPISHARLSQGRIPPPPPGRGWAPTTLTKPRYAGSLDPGGPRSPTRLSLRLIKRKARPLLHLHRGGASGAQRPGHPIRWEPGTATAPCCAICMGRGLSAGWSPAPPPLPLGFRPHNFRLPAGPCPPSRYLRPVSLQARAPMLPKRRRSRVGTPGAISSAACFPGVTIYLAEPRMGRSRRAFLTRLALSKGFRVLDVYRCSALGQAGPPT